MKKNILLLISAISALCYTGCSELGRIDQIDGSAPAPQALSIVNIKNTPGGAVIKIDVPNDENLMGAMAVYNRNGQECKTKASKYVDTLVIEGFGTTEPQDVLVYSVGKNDKLSQPVTATINPLTPPVHAVDFKIKESFGGVAVTINKNTSKADLAVGVLVDTVLTDIDLPAEKIKWADIATFHTAAEEITLTRRNLEPKSRIYGAYLRDRWNNHSDTIYKILTPIEEIELPKDTYKNGNLPSDYFIPAENQWVNYGLEKIWNNVKHDFYASSHAAPMPQWFTIDLGYTCSISRIQKYPRSDYELYSSTAPRIIEVYGSNNPNPDGSFDDSWTLLGRFEQPKPSGYGEGREVGPITDEDKDYWYNHTEFEMTPTIECPDPYMPVSYLRIKVVSTFATYGTESQKGQVIFGELTFWGQKLDDKK